MAPIRREASQNAILGLLFKGGAVADEGIASASAPSLISARVVHTSRAQVPFCFPKSRRLQTKLELQTSYLLTNPQAAREPDIR